MQNFIKPDAAIYELLC